MNINPNMRAEPPVQQPHAPNTQTGNGFEEADIPSRWDTTDTVEISQEAREKGRGGRLESKEVEVDYTAEDLAPLKQRFRELIDMERGIDGRISGILDKKGITLSPQDQLKIEITKEGKAIVGGVRDVKSARAIEEAINSDKKLLKEIADYQKEEKSLSSDIQDATGKSLKEYAKQVDELQRNGIGFGGKPPDDLRDPGLRMVDEEFATMLADHYAMKSPAITFSGENNILDDAEGTVNGMMSSVIAKVAGVFNEMNKATRIEAADHYGDDPEWLENSLVDLARLKISVDSNGQVTIEGTPSKGNTEKDQAAIKIINKMFEEELEPNPVTGKQHDFMIASAYLLNMYDETFGEGNPLGLGEANRTLETAFDRGEIESHVNSPEREAELTTEIDETAKDALEDMNIDAKDLNIEMNEDGKLAATNLDENDPKAKSILMALDVLNSQLEDRTIEDAQGKEHELANDPIKRLRGLMANMDVLRPGGASLLERSEKIEEANKAREDEKEREPA